jgi:tetratricopeptide (TPR) repeat protein
MRKDTRRAPAREAAELLNVLARLPAATLARYHYDMRFYSSFTLVAALGLLSACASLREPPISAPQSTTAPQPAPPPTGSAQPQPAPPTEQQAPPEQPPRPPPKQFRLGPAATALVAQAHSQANSGNFGQAAATVERALRIEPDNPLLWIELGRVRMGEGNASQADGMGHKALALATGDPQAQASAWRLIAEALRFRGRNQEAAEADQRAGAVAAR